MELKVQKVYRGGTPMKEKGQKHDRTGQPGGHESSPAQTALEHRLPTRGVLCWVALARHWVGSALRELHLGLETGADPEEANSQRLPGSHAPPTREAQLPEHLRVCHNQYLSVGAHGVAYLPTQLVALCQSFWQSEAEVRVVCVARESFYPYPR